MPADDVPTAAASPGPSTSEAPPPSPPVKTPKPKKTYSQVEIPTPDQLMQQEVLDSCLTRSVMAAFGGFVLGSGFGAFMGLTDIQTTDALTNEKIRAKQVAINTLKTARSRSWRVTNLSLQPVGEEESYAKAFGSMGAIYSGSECVIEKVRARHDAYNSGGAGCFTGAVLARQAGLQGMAGGCVTFAAFSVLMDKIMETP